MTMGASRIVPPSNVPPSPEHHSPDPRRLHEATDRLNTKLVDFEKALNELQLGVSARVLIDSDDRHDWVQYLAFYKQGNVFKLFVESGDGSDDDGQSWSTTTITSASREIRLKAVEHLPKLYTRLLAEFEAEIVRVNESIAQVESLAQAIRSKAGK